MISAAHGDSAMISVATAAYSGAAMPLAAPPLRRSARPSFRCNAGGGDGNAEDSDLKLFFQERDARIRQGLVGKTMTPDSLADLAVRHEVQEAAKAEEKEREAAKAEEKEWEAAKVKERNELMKYSILTLILFSCTKAIKEPRQSMAQLLMLLFAWIMKKEKIEGPAPSSPKL